MTRDLSPGQTGKAKSSFIIERDDLVYSVNEWDNYAVEEAIQLKDKLGGSVTVVTVGDEDSEEVLRREMAMGADNGLLLTDEAFSGSDGRAIARILKGAVEKGSYDLILTGDDVGESAARVKRVDYFMPEMGEGAEILEGDTEEVAAKLAEMLKAKGGIK